MRAIGAGLAAAFGSVLLYWAIFAATASEFAFTAIVAGFAVGKAVAWGSRGRGGWRYQALAIVLTYLAIVGSYVPAIITSMRSAAAASAAAMEAAPPSTDTPAAAGATSSVMADYARRFALLLALACTAPFLSALDNIVGLLILAVGFCEAWALNRKRGLTIPLARPLS